MIDESTARLIAEALSNAVHTILDGIIPVESMTDNVPTDGTSEVLEEQLPQEQLVVEEKNSPQSEVQILTTDKPMSDSYEEKLKQALKILREDNKHVE